VTHRGRRLPTTQAAHKSCHCCHGQPARAAYDSDGIEAAGATPPYAAMMRLQSATAGDYA